MEIDELFRKLKPVLGKRIDQLWLESGCQAPGQQL